MNDTKENTSSFSSQQEEYDSTHQGPQVVQEVAPSEPQEIKKMEEKPREVIVKTYRDFAVKALKGKPTSLAKMIIKEKKKKEFEYNYSPKNKKNILFMLLSSMLVILGVAAIAAIFVFSSNKKKEIEHAQLPVSPKSVIYFDYKIENDITDGKRTNIKGIALEAIEETNIPIGDVKIFYFIEWVEGEKQLVSTPEFIEILDTRAPLQLTRNIQDEFSLGVVSTIDGPLPFLVVKVKDFDISYSAMLAWEKSIMSDIGDIFAVNSKYNSQKFQDLDLYNQDTKSVLDEQGRVIFGYSFVDLETLVFFTSDRSFKKLLTSFQSNNLRV